MRKTTSFRVGIPLHPSPSKDTNQLPSKSTLNALKVLTSLVPVGFGGQSMKDETRWTLSSVDTITSLFKAVWWLPLKGGDVVRCVVVVVVAVIFEVECVRQLPQSTFDLHHSDTRSYTAR